VKEQAGKNGLSDSIQTIRGIGPKKADLCRKLGIETLLDAVGYVPGEYELRRAVQPVSSVSDGKDVSLCLEFISPPRVNRIRKGFSMTSMKGRDSTGTVECIWFNQPYRGRNCKHNHHYFVMGKAAKGPSGMQIQNPFVENYEEKHHSREQYLPLYRLTDGLTQKDLRHIVSEALKRLPDGQGDPDRVDVRLSEKYGFPGRAEAWRSIHFPESRDRQEKARQRLAFEEFLSLLTALAFIRKHTGSNKGGIPIPVSQGKLNAFLNRLPFRLTDSQTRVLHEVLKDLSGGNSMNRLIQGDVGSGKTVIAAAALFVVASAGYQGALMAPTEILARQHLATLNRMMEGSGIRLECLTGSRTESQKKQVKKALADGEIDILIGTHSLIREDVAFRNLGLVITDEQHRFGVRQRAMLQEKGTVPHVLVLSATPIPRTLVHVLYGDLDLSVIDSLPPGRIPIRTYCVPMFYRERIYRFVRKYAKDGCQSYVVCPLVEESKAKPDIHSVEEVYEELSHGLLSVIRMGLLHGRMKPQDKNQVMEDFAAGRVQVLVSTTVIEVGVDVPNARIMVIENADHFGLAQLHQLRGRVGRGNQPSFCILISDQKEERAIARMRTLVHSTDGFEIAEKDLELRGPGDLYGLRQHGIPDFRIADPLKDSALLQLAGKEADRMVHHPEGSWDRAYVKASVDQFMRESGEIVSA
jgi:ATP-dependent DNA helicase RecG